MHFKNFISIWSFNENKFQKLYVNASIGAIWSSLPFCHTQTNQIFFLNFNFEYPSNWALQN